MPRKKRSEWGVKGYLAFPKVVMENRDFRELSFPATKALMMLASQYNGKNNGDLSCTVKLMTAWGGMAPKTLTNALGELRDRDLIRRTRTHHWNSSGARPALYALSWLSVDECPGKDLDENAFDKTPRRFK